MDLVFISIGKEIFSLFDIWSIQHFFFGVFIGFFVNLYNKKHVKKLLTILEKPELLEKINYKNIFYFDLIAILLIAYIWETFEVYIDVGYWGPFLQSYVENETFLNRFLGDPLVLVLGYFLSIRFKYFKYFAFIFTFVFFSYHIFIDRINP